MNLQVLMFGMYCFYLPLQIIVKQDKLKEEVVSGWNFEAGILFLTQILRRRRKEWWSSRLQLYQYTLEFLIHNETFCEDWNVELLLKRVDKKMSMSTECILYLRFSWYSVTRRYQIRDKEERSWSEIWMSQLWWPLIGSLACKQYYIQLLLQPTLQCSMDKQGSILS